MPRTVRDSQIETRAARLRLKARGKPYYRAIEEGLHLGYRKPKTGSGKWLIRLYRGDGSYDVAMLGTADDMSDADGTAVLSYRQAQALARERMVKRAQACAKLTVASAFESYLKTLSPRTAADVTYRLRMILPVLGERELASLTADEIRDWHRGMAARGIRLRTGRGGTQKFADTPKSEDDRRRRQATANRMLACLKAALNHTFADGKVASDTAWRQVKPFKSVDRPRERYLTVAEAKRLINAADPDLRLLIQAALMTGARYGELCRLMPGDFNADTGSIAIRQSKSGKARHIELSDEGVSFFEERTRGRAGDSLMFTRADGSPWGATNQAKPMARACERGKIVPRITFHGFRYTWASLSIMNGMPMPVVSESLGHADGRMVERTYGHLSRDYLRKAIREHSPKFSIASGDNIKPTQGRK